MKPVVKTSLIAVASALIGGAVTAGTYKYLDSTKQPKAAIVATADDPFKNFFKEQNSLQQQINSLFDEHRKNFLIPWSKEHVINEATFDISEREDADNVYYDIKVGDLNQTSVNTDIKNGQITISGTTEKKDHGGDSQSYFKSSFQRTFPLPDNVDQENMQMLTEKDKIILKFPKLKA